MYKTSFAAYGLCIAMAILMASSVSAQGIINLARADDNFSHLKSDSLKQGLNRLKYIPLGNGNYLSVGGEWRAHYQVFSNINFGDVPPNYPEISTSQLNHRLMLHASVDLGNHFRLFAQLNNTLRYLNDNPPVPEIDENQLSLHQGFAEWASRSLKIRLGRQEMFYGAQRLFTVREGPNTRKTFDGITLSKNIKRGRFSLWVLSPTISQPKVFDDLILKEWVFGVYHTSYFMDRKIGLDLFAVNFQSALRKYNYQAGNEIRQTYGTRLFSNLQRFNFELEGAYQSGKFNRLKIAAYSLLLDVNMLLIPDQKGILGVTASIASGDKHHDDGQLNTYNLLFAKPAFGLAVPIGSSNMLSLQPYFKINPFRNFNLLAQVFFMARNSAEDGIYSPAMIENRPRPELLLSTKEKSMGTFYVLETSYQTSQNLSFGVDASWFKAGRFPKATGMGKNIAYMSFKAAFRF